MSIVLLILTVVCIVIYCLFCRKHVFGLSTSTYSGNTLFVLPSTPAAFSSRQNRKAGGRITEQQYNQRNSPSFIDHSTLVYASAGLGVVHNLAENTQLFFDDHKDDVTCITVSADGSLAATGCMGKNAVVHVWSTNIPLTDAKKSIATLGKGFFVRGVCSVEFSYDNTYILCVGCDDTHMLGVFHIATGARILEQSTQNGIPPMIKFVNYCPAPQYTEFISREHAGLCDIFATAGE
jgi:WD40 repeat protein